ncbi:MAG TPA: hypothetical protein VFU02_01600 [Polyangiaceae bacterium]|nr:hypothetical protein [Polyangiaceae bacterium]
MGPVIQGPWWSCSARWQKTARGVRRSVVAVTAIIAAYLVLLLNPEVLLAHEVRVQNLGFHASEPFPAGTERLLRQVLDRIQRSPFYDADDEYDVYLCSSPAEFTLFARGQRNVGAISMIGLTGHAFVRPSDIANNRLIGPKGQPVSGDRDLVYFIAHELAHTMVARRVGRLEYLRLNAWQQEGYADVLAKSRFDYAEALAAFRVKDRRLDPEASGLYLLYQLMFESQLRAGLTAEQLLSRPRDPAPITAQLELDANALESE